MYNKTRILVGPALEQLAMLPDNHFHTIVTSPPYWGLRSYKGDPGMIGMEPTWEDHVQNLLAVFRECRRVLRDDGTFWLNYGDAFATKGIYLKPKNLMLMPARLAIALQDDGWILRSEVIWHKPNPMPESVIDRPTSSHEKMYLFSKQPRYFYDHVAVRTPVARTFVPNKGIIEGTAKYTKIGKFTKTSMRKSSGALGGTANLRNVWSVATHAYRGAHFATYPPKLIIPCIKAGTSEKGCCTTCGAPWVRATESKFVVTHKRKISDHDLNADETDDNGISRGISGSKHDDFSDIRTTGWATDCDCNTGVVPCQVLDPFGGSGTTALVANQLRRDAVIIEISPEYADIAYQRISDKGGFLVDVSVE